MECPLCGRHWAAPQHHEVDRHYLTPVLRMSKQTEAENICGSSQMSHLQPMKQWTLAAESMVLNIFQVEQFIYVPCGLRG